MLFAYDCMLKVYIYSFDCIRTLTSKLDLDVTVLPTNNQPTTPENYPENPEKHITFSGISWQYYTRKRI